jgi:putative SOS response-associated peptidase YedK
LQQPRPPAADEEMLEIHDRMPVILDEADRQADAMGWRLIGR